MRTETIIKTYLSFNELSDSQKEMAIEVNFSDGWHYEHCLHERIDTLKAFAKYVRGALDYSISCVPNRGEFISVKGICVESLKDFLRDKKDCPLTGVCYDEGLRDALKKNSNMSDAFRDYLKSIHDEYEYMCTHEYIGELCEINNYEFDLDTLKMN